MKFFWVLWLFLVFGCKKDTTTRVEDTRETGSTIAIRNFTRDAIDLEGNLKWKLFAKETYFFAKESKTILYDVFVEQYEKNKVKASIKADKGEILQATHEMRVFGNIYLKTNDGKILETEELFYNTEDETIRSEKSIKITSQGTVIRGIGLEADKGMDKYKILKPQAVTISGNPLKK